MKGKKERRRKEAGTNPLGLHTRASFQAIPITNFNIGDKAKENLRAIK